MYARTRTLKAKNLGRWDRATFAMADDAPIQPGKLDPAHLLTPEQLAERLQVGVSFIYENTRKRAGVRNSDPLPSIRMGKYLRFYWPEVERWLARRQRQGGKPNA